MDRNVPWELRRDTAMALARSGNLAGADVLEEVMRRESSSRRLEVIEILRSQLDDPAARRIVAAGLEQGNSSSVQLKALSALEAISADPQVAMMVRPLLDRNESTSVQQKAIQILTSHMQLAEARSAVATSTTSGISS